MGSYNEFRDRLYSQALSRIAQEFLRHYRLLIERTGNDPSVSEKLSEDKELNDAVIELLGIRAGLEKRDQEFSRFIDREFCKALADFDERWSKVWTQIQHDSIGI